ncbi:MAG TPA: Vms1/Ankzf1 family peptidyl-tRNA hydrolase [Longimicrobiaceae bacterium]
MISRGDLERLMGRENGDYQILSLFLDMSVNSDNRRTHQIFLNQKRSQLEELQGDRSVQHDQAVNRALARVDQWLLEEFDEDNRGVVLYTEIGGDWFEALQFPVPVANRFVVSDRPAIAPLAQVLESYHHHGVVLLDREHVRLLSVYLGTLLDELSVEPTPLPTRHDIQAGGYSQSRFQRRKLEEMRHFFRDFAREVEDFVSRYRPDDLVILGTDENVARFREFLPERLRRMISYTGPMSVDQPASEVLQELMPHLEAERQRESLEILDQVRDRVDQDYLATAGFQSTLTALQEGKVDTLIIGQDQDQLGSRCTQCGFLFARELESCPYDGAPTATGIDVVEEAIRLAETQGAEVQFVAPTAVQDLRGVGALLRF